jgi:hypothetical protein
MDLVIMILYKINNVLLEHITEASFHTQAISSTTQEGLSAYSADVVTIIALMTLAQYFLGVNRR